jgi:hypothetical protein
MPTFTFTSPEGKSYDITGPAGATQGQAFKLLQGQLSGQPAPRTGYAGGSRETADAGRLQILKQEQADPRYNDQQRAAVGREISRIPAGTTQPAAPVADPNAGWGPQSNANAVKAPLGRPTQQSDPVLPYALNQLKKGASYIPGLLPLGYDIASYPIRKGMQAMGLPMKERDTEALPYSTRYARDVAPKVLQYNPNMPIPKDAYGKPNLFAEGAGHVAEFAGASLVPSAGVIAKSATPLIAAAKEAAAIVLSGEGATMGKHIAPKGYEGIGELAGSLSGPMLAMKGIDAVAGGSNWVRSKASDVGITGLSKASRDKAAATLAAQDAAAELGGPLAGPQVRQNMAQAETLAGKVPGLRENLTLGRMSNAPSIKATEQHFGATDEASHNLAHQKQAGLESAIAKQTDVRFPPPVVETPATAGVQRAQAEKIDRLDSATTRLESQERSLANKYQRGDSEQAGIQALEARSKLADTAKQAASARYSAAYSAADAAGLKVNMSDIRDLAGKINRDSGNTFQDKPGVIGDILRRYAPLAEKPQIKIAPTGAKIRQGVPFKPSEPIATLQEFHSLYKQANADMASLGAAAKMGNADAGQQARMLAPIREQLKAKITEMEGPQYGNVGKMLKDANQFYATKYAQLFKRGVGGEMVAPGRFGPTSANENSKIFSSLVFKPRDASGVREYLEMAGNDKPSLDALQNGVMDIFSKRVVRDGKISPQAVEAFKREYKEPLQAVPWIAKQIDTADNSARSLAANRARVIDEQRAFSKSAISKLAGSENPQTAITGAFNSPSKMTALVGSARTPDEKRAVARSIVDYASSQKNPLEFMAANRKVLEQSLGKTQVRGLETVLQAKELTGRVQAPEFLSFEKLGDPLSKAIGTSIPQALSEAKGISNRFASPSYGAARVLTRYMNKMRNEQREKIIAEAIYNPDVMSEIMKYAKDPSIKNKAAIDAHMLPYTVRAASEAFKQTVNPPQ